MRSKVIIQSNLPKRKIVDGNYVSKHEGIYHPIGEGYDDIRIITVGNVGLYNVASSIFCSQVHDGNIHPFILTAWTSISFEVMDDEKIGITISKI